MYLIDKISNKIITLLFILSIIEAIFFSVIDCAGTIMFAFAWIILSKTVFTQNNIIKHTIPFFIIFAYAICFFFLPVVCTLIEQKPLSCYFKIAAQTFFHQFLFLSILVIAFVTMTKISKINSISNFLYKKTMFFEPLISTEIWIIGLIGFCCMAYSIFGSDTSLLGKIADGFKSFSTAPILLLFPQFYRTRQKISKKTINYIIIYIIIFIGLGMAANSRSAILLLIVNTSMIILLFLLLNNVSIRRIIKIKYLTYIIIGFFLITGPMSDLGIAMIGVRNMRSNVSPSELMVKTWEFYTGPNFSDFKKQFHKTTKVFNDKDTWSEDYVDNVFLNRLCNLRISDASLFLANQLGYDNKQMQISFKEQLIANLPAIFVGSAFKESTRYSAGDKLYTLVTGNEGIGSYRVAGYTGVGLATFGYAFYPISLLVFIILFYALDAFSIIRNGKWHLSILALLLIDKWFYFLNNGAGIIRNVSYIMRGYFQDIILYLILVFIIKKIIKRV